MTINQQKFRWRLNIGAKSNTVALQGALSSGQQVIVTLHGWYDPWEFVGNFDKLPNNPQAITARFAAQAIRFALARGWQPEHSGPPIYLDYHNGSCLLSQTVGDLCHFAPVRADLNFIEIGGEPNPRPLPS